MKTVIILISLLCVLNAKVYNEIDTTPQNRISLYCSPSGVLYYIVSLNSMSGYGGGITLAVNNDMKPIKCFYREKIIQNEFGIVVKTVKQLVTEE